MAHPKHGFGMLFVHLVCLLAALLVSPTIKDCAAQVEFSGTLDPIADSLLCQLGDIVAGENGILYVLWLARGGRCDQGPTWAGWNYCEELNLTAMASGRGGTTREWTQELAFPSYNDLYRNPSVKGRIRHGLHEDTLYITWSGRPDCNTEPCVSKYATLLVAKTDDPTYSVNTEVGITDPNERTLGGAWLAFDSEANLHFGFGSGRCDADPETGRKHDFSVPFYRKRSADGTWEQGPYICDRNWSDDPSMVTYELQGNCDYCPRDYLIRCVPDSAHWHKCGAPNLLVDSQDNLHAFWHDTGCSGDILNGYPVYGADQVLYRQITKQDPWGPTHLISTGIGGTFVWTQGMIPDDKVLVIYNDSYEDTCGLYYRFKPAGVDTFTKHRMALADTSPCSDSKITDRVEGVRFFYTDDSKVHLIALLRTGIINCPIGPDEGGGPQPLGGQHEARDLFYRVGELNHVTGQITWDPAQDHWITEGPDTLRKRAGVKVVEDACGRIHLFYWETDSPCIDSAGKLMHQVVVDPTTTLEVLYPAGGEEWQIDSTYNIAWRLCPRTDEKVRVKEQRVHLKREAGPYSEITTSPLGPLARIHEWQATGPPSDNCEIMIEAVIEKYDPVISDWIYASTDSASSASTFVIKCVVGPEVPPIDPDQCLVEVSLNELCVCPCGEGEDVNTLVVSATLRDTLGDPLGGVCCPLEVLLTPVGADDRIHVCGGNPLYKEGLTGANGGLTLSTAQLGGCGDIDVTVSAFGIELPQTSQISINSPDIDGDGDVGLVDFGEFAQMYHTSELCGDYNRDSLVSLVDFGTFAIHYLHECPDPTGCNVSPRHQVAGRVMSVVTPGDQVGSEGRQLRDFSVNWDGFDHRRYQVAEVLIAYDASVANPLRWKGCGDLHIMRTEELAVGEGSLNLARVIAVLDDACGTEEGVLGAMEFELLSAAEGFSPRIEQVLAAGHGGKIEDVTSRVRPGGTGTPIAGERLVLRPRLELSPNPTTGLVSVRFGVPTWMGRQVRVLAYDARGRYVAEIYDGTNNGYAQAAEVGNGGGAISLGSPGVYFVRLTVDGKALKTAKLVLLK